MADEELKKETVEQQKVDEALDTFRDAWLQMPPLIRAAVAASVVDHVTGTMDYAARRAMKEGAMPRRVEVENRLVSGFAALRDLGVALANQADEEAASAPIDVNYPPTDHAANYRRERYGWQFDSVAIHSAIAGQAHEGIAGDVDREVLKGLGDDGEG